MDFLADLPLWVWALVVPIVIAVLTLIARWTSNKWDDWLVAVVSRALGNLAEQMMKRHQDPDDELDLTDIIDAVTNGSARLKGPGMDGPNPFDEETDS